MTQEPNQVFAAPRVFQAAGSDAVLSTALGEGIALLDLRANEYFTLNAVGALLWNRLQQPQSKDELVEAVRAEYDIDAASCAGDVDGVLDDLVAARLVHVR